MNVTVNFGQPGARNNWKVVIPIKPFDTVENLKQTIQKCKDIPADMQILQLESSVISDERTLQSYNVASGTVFQLDYRLNVLAIVHSRESFEIEADCYETLGSLKAKIAEKLKKDANKLVLFSDENVTDELNGKRCLLRHTHRTNNSADNRNVYVKIFEGEDYFPVYVETSSGKTVSLLVHPSDTVKITTERLLLSLKIFTEGFEKVVRLSYNDTVMDESKTLSDYGVQVSSRLKASLVCSEVSTFTVQNNMNKTITLTDVTLLNTVGEIKQKVASITGVGSSFLRLMNFKRGNFLNNDSRTLFDCGITSPQTELCLLDGNAICIANELIGKTFVALPPKNGRSGLEMTVKQVKTEFRTRSGVDVGDQSLSFRGMSLDPVGSEQLVTLGVKEMSTLQLSIVRRRRRPQILMKVFVSRHVGKLSILASEPTDRLAEEMGKKSGINLSTYSCVIEAKIPAGATSLATCRGPAVAHFQPPAAETAPNPVPTVQAVKLEARPVLKPIAIKQAVVVPAVQPSAPPKVSLQPQTKACGDGSLFVKMLTGETVNVAYDPKDTVLKLKEKLFKKSNIPIDQQRLIFAGKQLGDDDIVRNCNLENGDTLHLVTRLVGC